MKRSSQMSLDQFFKNIRKEELKAMYKFIYMCDVEELASIIEEIRCVHDNLMALNEDTRLLAKIESVSINGECIQLNIEKEHSNDSN